MTGRVGRYRAVKHLGILPDATESLRASERRDCLILAREGADAVRACIAATIRGLGSRSRWAAPAPTCWPS